MIQKICYAFNDNLNKYTYVYIYVYIDKHKYYKKDEIEVILSLKDFTYLVL